MCSKLSIEIPEGHQLHKYFTILRRSRPKVFGRIPVPKKSQNLHNLPAMESFLCRRKWNNDDNEAKEMKSYTEANLFQSCRKYLLRDNNNNARI